MTPEQDVPTEAPPLDALSHDYVTLAFGIERHVEGLVDAYYGPPAVRNAALAGEAQAPAALVEAAGTLHERITAADLPASRRGYLHAQVRALATICRKLAGEPVPYGDEVRLCFDIEPVRTPDRVYDEAVAKLDDALPGSGSPAERMIARRRRFEVTPEQAMATAKKYWDPARLNIVAVGDAMKIRDVLAKKGMVEVFDAEGSIKSAGQR